MKQSNLIAAGALAFVLAALLVVPAWPGAAEATADEGGIEAPTTRGYLGVGLRQLTPELQTHFGASEGSGVLVASVSGDSPAAAAGIRVGDVITAVDGLAVDSPRDLSREVRHRPGDSVAIDLVRDGRPLQITATLAERQANAWHHGRASAEEWAELAERWGEEHAERWGKWGEEFAERWGEEFAERWGEEFAERWGDEHAESWQRWAEEMAERGEGWEKMGEEIGRTVEQALGEIDWEAIGKSVEESMKAIESTDWEAMSERIERQMEELERRLEERTETAPSEE